MGRLSLFLLSAVLSTAILTSNTFPIHAYEITNSDELIIQNAQQKLIELADRSDNDAITVQSFIDTLDDYLFDETKVISDRVFTVLDELAWRLYEYNTEAGEWQTLTPEDCYDDEYYDADDQWCYLIIDQENIDWDDINYESDDEYNFHNYTDDDDEYEETLAIYSHTDNTLTLTSGVSTDQYTSLRNDFTTLFPTRYTAFITEVIFYENTVSDTAAFVERHEGDAGTWKLAINTDGILWDEEYQSVLENTELFVHEMMHIITLNDTQMEYVLGSDLSDEEYDILYNRCQNHIVFEGCMQATSYLDDFVEQFWTEAMISDALDEKNKYKESDYVSDYAATNEGEDIAESFALYVMQVPLEDATTIAEQKIEFFDNYPELSSLRTYIRNQLASY